MFFKRRKQKRTPTQVVEEVNLLQVRHGCLESSQLNPQLLSHYGVPNTSCSLCFDPVQRLLAICTVDGRIKLYGKDGVEGLLRSDQQLPFKFMQFVDNCGQIISITLRNDIQVWDLNKGDLAHSHRWHAEITAFSVIQGSPYMYIGEDSGNVVVLQYDRDENRLCQMPYWIPADTVFGGLAIPSYARFPSVVSILPQPDGDYNRVLLAYGNGSIVLWGLHEAQVLTVWGLAYHQLEMSIGNTHDSGVKATDNLQETFDEDYTEEKDICCACWACPSGTVLAVGYTDGDIWFWGFQSLSLPKVQPCQESSTHLCLSNGPLLKLQVSSVRNRAPVVVLRWSNGRKINSGGSGQLYVFGGGDLGCPEILTIFLLKWIDGSFNNCNISRLELSLNGPFNDMILLPGVTSSLNDPAATLLVLTSPGQLHAYEEVSIAKHFESLQADIPSSALPQPILLQEALADPAVTVAKIISIPDDAKTSWIFSLLPRHFKGIAPSLLPYGTKWPVMGGVLDASSLQESTGRMIYISGHRDGSVNVWDASLPLLSHICNLQEKANEESLATETASISALEFCPFSGTLVIADVHGVVWLYTLSADSGDVSCLVVNKSTNQEQIRFCDTGFQCIAIFNIHQAPIYSVAVSSNPSHVAIGCTSGWVSVLDVNSCSVLFHGLCFSNRCPRIISLIFGPAPAFMNDASTPSALPSNFSDKGLQSQPFNKTVLYAATEASTVVVVDQDSGLTFDFPWHIENSSKTVSLHLINNLETACNSFEENVVNTSNIYEQSSDTENTGERGSFAIAGSVPVLYHLLLCNEDSLHIYCLSNSLQGFSSSLQSVRLQSSCCWASTFVNKNAHGAGLVVVDTTGCLQIRSLPGMEVVKEASLDECLSWKFQPGSNFSRTITCDTNGKMALIERDRELIFISLFKDNSYVRVTKPLLSFFDKDIAAAVDAAFTAGSYSTRRKSQIQGLLGVVLKDLKEGVLKSSSGGLEQTLASNAASDLSKLFATSGATVREDAHLQAKDTHTEVQELELDDIYIEDELLNSPPLNFSPPSIIGSNKGKEKQSDITDDRVELFSGEEGGGKPRRRTAQEIKAAYGHKQSGEISGAAGLARDKLLERQEKLQDLAKRTEEMQEGAENFSSMAAELAKAIEGRKWWQL